MKDNRRFLFVAAAVLCASAGLLQGCSKKDEALLTKANALARTCHEALVSGDTRKLLDLADYPFDFRGLVKEVKDEEELKALIEKNRTAIRQKVQPANKIELITYEDFVAGQEFANVKLSKTEAENQARRVALRPGGILVRCYFFDPDKKKEDGRSYYLCLHLNSLNELKVTTYYD